MGNPWFRMYAEFAHDPKVQMMNEVNQRRLLMIFCIRCNGDVTLQDEEMAFQLRVTPEEWAKTKAEFIARGFIDDANNILNWDKRQFRSDSSRERVSKHRAAKKQPAGKPCNVTVTPPDTEQNRTDKSSNAKASLHETDSEKPKTKTMFQQIHELGSEYSPKPFPAKQQRNYEMDQSRM